MEVSIDDDRNNTIIVHDTGSCNQDRNGIENKIIMTSSKNKMKLVEISRKMLFPNHLHSKVWAFRLHLGWIAVFDAFKEYYSLPLTQP